MKTSTTLKIQWAYILTVIFGGLFLMYLMWAFVWPLPYRWIFFLLLVPVWAGARWIYWGLQLLCLRGVTGIKISGEGISIPLFNEQVRRFECFPRKYIAREDVQWVARHATLWAVEVEVLEKDGARTCIPVYSK